ncbi:LysM peptidoglycan-binding domain-containing protein [Derxia gummosa]|uniref:LysM peptidoglycan-binding domain-containing protein n=1 Tax=Derxia gummosa DSM 723 TaxID=1121388 RepID=A0A8B6X0G4_9BURK|nr:LysM domain-containing protein [Derxia gummosa]
MKKSSTALLGAALAIATSLQAAPAVEYPVTPRQRNVADQVAQAGVPLSELALNAPDSYTVKPGDTLWGISGLFLKSPWRWPELWGMNRDQIRNPHLIYPGQILMLEKSNGRALLKLGTPVGGAGGTVKLSPHIRVSGAADGAIPSINPRDIEPFLNRPLIVTEEGIAASPRVVATQEDRVITGTNDIVYVRGMPSGGGRSWQVYRPAAPLRDPETNRVIAYEAVYCGVADVSSNGDPATLRIKEAREEIRVGDRLVPTESSDFPTYMPHAASTVIDGRVVSIYNGVDQAATGMVIALNRGAAQGVERGHVFRLLNYGGYIVDRTAANGGERVRLPDEPVGDVFVFRVFENISYGLILRSTNTTRIGDRFVSKLD